MGVYSVTAAATETPACTNELSRQFLVCPRPLQHSEVLSKVIGTEEIEREGLAYLLLHHLFWFGVKPDLRSADDEAFLGFKRYKGSKMLANDKG